MIFMASFTERDAAVEITDHRVIYQSGRGEGGEEVSVPGNVEEEDVVPLANIATLFFDFAGKGIDTGSVKATVSQSNQGRACKHPDVSVLKPPDAHYAHESASNRWAVVVWADPGPDPHCWSFSIDLGGAHAQVSCTVTLVSGAHFEVREFRSGCPPRFTLRSSGKKVYRLGRWQW